MTSDEFFKRIETQFRDQLPFVAYRQPNAEKVNAILQNNDAVFFTKNFSENGFVFAPFDDAEKSVLMPLENSEQFSCDIPLVSIEKSYKEIQIDKEDKAHHINLVEKAVEAINNNLFKKVVVSRKETVNLSEENPISILKPLLNSYKSAFIYCWYHPKIGLWLGATPETLIKIDGHRFSIMALAGTQDYNGTLDVVWQDKEKQEQQLVTDFIVNHLEPSVESIKISEVETVKAGNLVHLKTMISAHLKPEISLQQVITALHPTPAVCGLPKEEAKKFILKNENSPREFYTGFLGELNFETTVAPRLGRRNIENRAYAMSKSCTQLYVNLRCMQIKNHQALIYVGGGITEHSNPESEWEETVSKSFVIKSIL